MIALAQTILFLFDCSICVFISFISIYRFDDCSNHRPVNGIKTPEYRGMPPAVFNFSVNTMSNDDHGRAEDAGKGFEEGFYFMVVIVTSYTPV